MPTYQHSGWRQEPTTAAKIAKIDLFLTELTDRVTANVAKGPASRDSSSLNQLIRETEEQRMRLVDQLAREQGGGIRPVWFGR